MGKVSLKIGFDRLALLALLDRSATFLENSASVILSVGVAAMTGLLLNQNHYQDLSTFLVCGVAAGCQYSLLKSVQVWPLTQFFPFPFCKENHWFARRANQWPLVGEILFSFVPTSNSLVSVSNAWRVFSADRTTWALPCALLPELPSGRF